MPSYKRHRDCDNAEEVTKSVTVIGVNAVELAGTGDPGYADEHSKCAVACKSDC